MRIEYIVVSIILMLVVFAVILTILSGVTPTIDPLLKLIKKG